MARAAAGDVAAFEDLVTRHAPTIHGLARRLLDDDDEADDAAQEAFVRAWRGLPRFGGRSAFRTWLYRIALRTCADRRAARARRRVGRDDDFASDGLPDLRGPSVEGHAARGDEARALRAAVAALPERQRVLITLHYLEGLRYDELTAVTGWPLGTIKVTLHRARARLRAALGERLGREETPR